MSQLLKGTNVFSGHGCGVWGDIWAGFVHEEFFALHRAIWFLKNVHINEKLSMIILEINKFYFEVFLIYWVIQACIYIHYWGNIFLLRTFPRMYYFGKSCQSLLKSPNQHTCLSLHFCCHVCDYSTYMYKYVF